MNARITDFKLGLFILGSIAILIAAVFIFAASRLFEGKTIEETYVARGVEGLKVGAPVLLRGVPVGEVTRINFSWNIYHYTEPRYVVVEFAVGNKVSLVPPGPRYAERVREEVAKGLRAQVKSQGLAGGTIVSLEYMNPREHPALEVPWTPRHVYIPSAPGQFSEIVASLDKISANLQTIDFQKIGSQVEKDLAAMEKLVNHFNQADVAGVSSNLNGLVTELRGASVRLEDFLGRTNQLSNANLATITTNVDHLVSELGATSARLDQMLGNVDESSLNASLQNLQLTSEELQEAVARFKEYPAGTLFGRKPPRAGSVEAPR